MGANTIVVGGVVRSPAAAADIVAEIARPQWDPHLGRPRRPRTPAGIRGIRDLLEDLRGAPQIMRVEYGGSSGVASGVFDKLKAHGLDVAHIRRGFVKHPYRCRIYIASSGRVETYDTRAEGRQALKMLSPLSHTPALAAWVALTEETN